MHCMHSERRLRDLGPYMSTTNVRRNTWAVRDAHGLVHIAQVTAYGLDGERVTSFEVSTTCHASTLRMANYDKEYWMGCWLPRVMLVSAVRFTIIEWNVRADATCLVCIARGGAL